MPAQVIRIVRIIVVALRDESTLATAIRQVVAIDGLMVRRSMVIVESSRCPMRLVVIVVVETWSMLIPSTSMIVRPTEVS